MKAGAPLCAAILWALLAGRPAAAAVKAAYMHYMKAILLQHQGDYAGALQEYAAASALDPQSTYVLEQAVELALETGQPAQALDLAQRLAELDSQSPKARLLLGNVHWARGEVPAAQKSFEEALKLNPKFSDAMFALGNLLNAQSPAKAKSYFEQYLAANPDRAAEAHFQIALVDQRLNLESEAIAHLKNAEELEPDFLQARYTLAHIYEVRHDTDAALGEYLGLLDRETDNVALLNHIGEVYYSKVDYASAASYFERSKAAAPRNPGACLWLAILAEQKGDFDRAAAQLADSAALKEEPELPLRLSYYLTQANRLKEAVAVLEEAHRKWTDNNEIAYFLALGYDDLKNPEKAIALLREIVKRVPDSRDARFQMGALYEKMNKVDDMEREFRALIEQRPSDASALNYLGYSLADRGLKLGEAEGFIRRAVSIDPRSGAFMDSLGWCRFKQGRLPEALEELQSALKLDPEDAAIWEHLGDVQKAQGDAVAAWTSWKTGLSYEPRNDKLSRKAAEAEAAFSAQDLGARLLDYLGRVHGDIARLGSLCDVAGTIGDKAFAYRGLLTYEAPARVRLELLGPLFIPMFRMELSSGTFAMDSLPLPGVSPEAEQESARQTLQVLRDYFARSVFDERPAQYHKGWRTRWIGTATRQIFLDDSNGHVQGLKTSGPSPLRLSLDDFRAEHGRQVPRFLQLEGKGFSISLRLSNPTVTYAAPTAPASPAAPPPTPAPGP